MKKSLLLFSILIAGRLFAQSDFTYKTKDYKLPLFQSGIYGEPVSEVIQWGDELAAPEPSNDYDGRKNIVNKQRFDYAGKLNKKSSYITTPGDIVPIIDTSFNGQATGSAGIPNDNHIAVSNDGKVISVQNSTIRVLDENGKTLMFKTLYAFANGNVMNLSNECYDPKVVYDPGFDRFIVFYLHGSKVSNSFGILAFSATNDPTGAWNFYKLPGNAIKNTKWSDYPILAISQEDVFVTLNLLTEDTDWRVGFNQSIIWQIGKKEGYNAATLNQKLYYDIRYKTKAVWSICPVQGGYVPTHPNMYFLSVRPGDIENDTLFVHEISNTVSSGKASLSMKILKTDKPYGLPPVAPQPFGGDTLQTNDTRVLGGVYHQGKIQYVQTSVVKPYFHSGVFHGMFDVSSSSTVNAHYISFDTVDYAYPSIAYAGKGLPYDQSTVITFSCVSAKSFPGTSAVYHTRHPGLPSIFSNEIRIKSGEKNIDRLPRIVLPYERWGDYTGIQYQYNKPGTLWLAGSFGNKNSSNGTWIGKLNVENNSLKVETDFSLHVYPNPLNNITALGFILVKSETIIAELCEASGKVVTQIFSGELPAGYNELHFDSDNIAHGTYYVYLKGGDGKKKYFAKLIK